MAFALNQLRQIAQGAEGGVALTLGGPNVVNNIFHYATGDTLVTVEGANYFDLAIAQLNVGDLIFVSAGIGGTLQEQEYVVSSVTTHVAVVRGGSGDQAASVAALTDNSGGTNAGPLAAIAAGATYLQADLVALKNGVATLNGSISAILTALKNAGVMASP